MSGAHVLCVLCSPSEECCASVDINDRRGKTEARHSMCMGMEYRVFAFDDDCQTSPPRWQGGSDEVRGVVGGRGRATGLPVIARTRDRRAVIGVDDCPPPFA